MSGICLHDCICEGNETRVVGQIIFTSASTLFSAQQLIRKGPAEDFVCIILLVFSFCFLILRSQRYGYVHKSKRPCEAL